MLVMIETCYFSVMVFSLVIMNHLNIYIQEQIRMATSPSIMIMMQAMSRKKRKKKKKRARIELVVDNTS